VSTRAIGLFDEGYPPELRSLATPPDALWVRGALPVATGVAVVGTRQPSDEALRFAFQLGAALARENLVVWSGGALGIDQAAHEGALSAGGASVLVAGGGLDARFPADRNGLYARVGAAGALVSIVDDRVPPQPWIFLARNGVLAAMTSATVVVECPLRSGARSTAAAARRLGRPVWIAPQAPWSPFVRAVREEHRLGARLLMEIPDLIASLQRQPQRPALAPAPRRRADTASTRSSDERPVRGATEQLVLQALADADREVGELCEQLNRPAGEVLAAVSSLCLSGEVEERSGGVLSRSNTRKQ
jgi:DNA processing protein